jgi:hypothetical protein
MNKPTSQRQTVERPNDNDASYRSSGGAKNIVSFGAPGYFVRIRMMLRPRRKPVKRRRKRKPPLPIKNAGCLAGLFTNRAAGFQRKGALARLYTNGILARV